MLTRGTSPRGYLQDYLSIVWYGTFKVLYALWSDACVFYVDGCNSNNLLGCSIKMKFNNVGRKHYVANSLFRHFYKFRCLPEYDPTALVHQSRSYGPSLEIFFTVHRNFEGICSIKMTNVYDSSVSYEALIDHSCIKSLLTCTLRDCAAI